MVQYCYLTQIEKIMTISVKNNGRNNQKTLTKFKNMVNNEGIIEAYKAKRYYVKPSLAKKLKREAAQKQRIRDEIEEIRQLQKNWDDIF